MKLWGGRFDKEVSEIMNEYNSSLPFDKVLFEEDITGSIAHTNMLVSCNILTKQEGELIIDSLQSILNDIMNKELLIEGDYEDIHSFVEIELTKRIGDVGKKLHTARSRNDQVALDMRLFTKKETANMILLVDTLLEVIDNLKSKNDFIMPGYTHLQRAQVITVPYYLDAYKQMFKRDKKRLTNALDLLDESPLGAGALAGTTHKIDREYTSSSLGFKQPVKNFIDAVSDRDYLLELMSIFSIFMMHMSRLSEELIVYSSQEFNFVKIDSAFATGSSIMPQKRNPDGAELIRGKTGRVYGNLITLLVTMKGLPLAYNKDMQEDKEAFFDALITTKNSVKILTAMLDTLTFNEDVLLKSVKAGFLNATALADYLVNKGVAFRDAHELVGEVIKVCEQHSCAIEDLELSLLQEVSDVIKEDVFEFIDYNNILSLGNKIEMKHVK